MPYQTFRFQKVMDVKNNEKEKAKEEYAESLRGLHRIKSELDELNALKSRWEQKWSELANQSVSVQRMIELQNYLQRIAQQIKDKEEESSVAERFSQAKQITLIDKAREMQVWEKWKERAEQEVQAEALRKEQKEMDELGIQRYTGGGGHNGRNR